MFGWLQDLVNQFVSDINNVWQWVIRAIQAVYSYIESWIGSITYEILSFANEVVGWIDDVYRYIGSWLVTLGQWIQDAYNYLGYWVNRIYNDVYNWLGQLGRWMTQQIQDIKNLINQLLNQLVQWIINYVYLPLFNLISSDVSSIWNTLSFVYSLISDPAALVAYLGRFLWDSWLELLKRYSQPIARWLLKSMTGMASEVASVLETILSQVI